MNVIQHKETRQFIGISGWWTSNLDDAAEFNSMREAIRYCLERGINRDVQLVPLNRQHARPMELFPAEE